MTNTILDEIKDYDVKTRKSLELLVELTVKKLAPLVTIEGTRMWQGEAYKDLSKATKEQLAEAEKILEKNYEFASHLMCVLHTCCMTVRTAESYRQKALTMAEPFKDVSRKISAEDALAAMSPEAMQMLMEKLKARLGVKADAEGKTL